MTEQKALPAPEKVEKLPEPEIIEPIQIVTEAYKSLDRQIAKLDQIPVDAENSTQKLLDIVLKDPDVFAGSIFDKKKGEFVTALLSTSEQVGHAFHTILEIMREKAAPEKPANLQMPQLPMAQNMKEQPNPNMVVQTQQPKGGGFFDWLQVRRYASTIEKYLQMQKDVAETQITSAKVMDILDYGRQLEAEWMRLLDFYDKGIKWLSFFNDKETYRNQHQEVETHIIKMVSIIRAFSRTIVEYRKERFGDRKVGVAAGAMWLEAAKASASGRPGAPVSIDPNALNMRDRVR